MGVIDYYKVAASQAHCILCGMILYKNSTYIIWGCLIEIAKAEMRAYMTCGRSIKIYLRLYINK